METLMPDDNDTEPSGEYKSPKGPDPLGIIGWSIGGKYKITSYIGGGGFGEVYAGYNENLTAQRLVIKFFKRVQEREKFDKEAKILCLLDHPNISRVIDYLPDEGAVVVAFIDGKDGKRILKESGALSEKMFLNVARSLTSAMAYAHSRKIAHRDIKPDNIIVDKNDHVYIIDFGIAKEMGGEATRTGYQALTPMIAAPERQQGNRDYNPFISDIYEIGVTLFNFATNSLPYRNPVNPNVSEWGGEVAEKLSPELRVILRKATHPDPKRRYQTAAELAGEFKDLTRVYGGRKAHKRPALTVAAVIIVIAAAIGIFLGRHQLSGLWRDLFPAKQVSTQAVSETEKPKGPEELSLKDTVSIEKQKPLKEEPVVEKAKEKPKPKVTVRTGEQTAQEEITTAQKPPAEEKKEIIKQPEKEKQAPPPPMSRMAVQVIPDKDISMWVDATQRQSGQSFKVKPGRHELTIVHPDYPVYRKRVSVGDDPADVVVDFEKEFAVAGSVDIQLALSPPSDNHILELLLNGRKKTITRFPVFGMEELAGEWQLELSLIPIDPSSKSSAQVDSCVTFPYGGGSRFVLRGGKGIIRMQSNQGERLTSVPVVIFWSDK
jgi:serine/threonine protein kinase